MVGAISATATAWVSDALTSNKVPSRVGPLSEASFISSFSYFKDAGAKNVDVALTLYRDVSTIDVEDESLTADGIRLVTVARSRVAVLTGVPPVLPVGPHAR